jgi:VWFA-related protein
VPADHGLLRVALAAAGELFALARDGDALDDLFDHALGERRRARRLRLVEERLDRVVFVLVVGDQLRIERLRQLRAVAIKRVRLDREPPRFPRLVERIRSRKPQGFTAMYDALGVYLDGATYGPGRKILVVFTDGGDTRSAIRFGDAMTLIRASDVTVYSIGFLENQSGRARAEQRLRLTQIAAESGGAAFFPSSMTQVDEAYDTIAAQIRAQYTLGYVSTNTAADGNWRKVEVRVKRPDVSGTRVQARKGYFAPYRKD